MKFSSNLPKESTKGSVKLSLIDQQQLKIPQIATWSLNILSVNEAQNEIYLSDDDKLKILSLTPTFDIALKNTLTMPAFRGQESRINHILLTTCESELLLIILTNSGMIFIFFPENWERSPMLLDNTSQLHEDSSVWSCSLFGKFLAVGSNTHLITIWNLDTLERKIIECHTHNIPCVDFNSKGQLASTSIDSNVYVSSVVNELLLSCKPCTEWGWAVKWIPRNSVALVNSLHMCNMPNTTGRYRSSLPTYYFNQNENIHGIFDINETSQYFNSLRRRLIGLPNDSESDDEDDMEVEESEGNCQENENFESSLLIQTTKSSVHLIDPKLYKMNEGGRLHVLAVYIPSIQMLRGNVSRLSLLHFLEEFSMCIVGNQFGVEVLFLRVCKKRNKASIIGWDYSFVMEISIVLNGRIIALSVNSCGGYALMYALTENMSFYVFKVMSTSVEKLRVIDI